MKNILQSIQQIKLNYFLDALYLKSYPPRRPKTGMLEK